MFESEDECGDFEVGEEADNSEDECGDLEVGEEADTSQLSAR